MQKLSLIIGLYIIQTVFSFPKIPETAENIILSEDKEVYTRDEILSGLNRVFLVYAKPLKMHIIKKISAEFLNEKMPNQLEIHKKDIYKISHRIELQIFASKWIRKVFEKVAKRPGSKKNKSEYEEQESLDMMTHDHDDDIYYSDHEFYRNYRNDYDELIEKTHRGLQELHEMGMKMHENFHNHHRGPFERQNRPDIESIRNSIRENNKNILSAGILNTDNTNKEIQIDEL